MTTAENIAREIRDTYAHRFVSSCGIDEIAAIISRHLAAPQQAAWQEAIDVADSVQNANDLNDGGFFEAGFIAAKTKIIDALIEKRDAPKDAS